MKHIILIAISAILLASCQTPAPKCKHGEATAIFSPSMKMVTYHKFEAKDRNGMEQVAFGDSLKLTVLQSGCEKLTQTFEFKLPGDYRDYQEPWNEFAAELLYEMGGADPSVDGFFTTLSTQVGTRGKDAPLGQPFEIASGLKASVQKVASANELMVIVEVSE